jgi:hypothetical protein
LIRQAEQAFSDGKCKEIWSILQRLNFGNITVNCR